MKWQANWSEFDLAKRQWVIPAARMKGKNTGSKKLDLIWCR